MPPSIDTLFDSAPSPDLHQLGHPLPPSTLSTLIEVYKQFYSDSYTYKLARNSLTLFAHRPNPNWPDGEEIISLASPCNLEQASEMMATSSYSMATGTAPNKWVLRDRNEVIAIVESRVCTPEVAKDVQNFLRGKAGLKVANEDKITIRSLTIGYSDKSLALVMPGTGEDSTCRVMTRYGDQQPSWERLSSLLINRVNDQLREQNIDPQAVTVDIEEGGYVIGHQGGLWYKTKPIRSFENPYGIKQACHFIEAQASQSNHSFDLYISTRITQTNTWGSRLSVQLKSEQGGSFVSEGYNLPPQHLMMLGEYLDEHGSFTALSQPVDEVCGEEEAEEEEAENGDDVAEIEDERSITSGTTAVDSGWMD
ncbi:hypothetical protein TREMEDRAFT_72771 [Tremella mesenterica DSM 1558]|uniref:uncharacterized protein n=1 Tax=Tremella mesenterica (strain ATCC 24925 / CBS 8224 / DSM 1558 / NBRC 9311 / NRRL Y-6157 / RJB 2259-6 / UBC 559-6) TaxID=578456 RepID=UPI0003F49348|nr:uncharacterized protein TREMEDRAFT_72771 [Tremella mesenterica DSM 1558]EIW72464.1 hypothetical protein TREMEDRAFT_72771 [Tremella mesenterica DSM 1558]